MEFPSLMSAISPSAGRWVAPRMGNESQRGAIGGSTPDTAATAP
jgi:hypothetical protein